MNSSPILATDIIGNDPLVKILRIKPLVFAVFVFVGGILYQFGLSAALGYLEPATGITRSAIVDYFNMVNFLFIIPAVAYYYLFQPVGIANVYQSILSFPRSTDTSSVEIIKWHRNPLPWVGGLLIAVVTVWLGIVDNLTKLGAFWYAADWLAVALLQLFRALTIYMMVVIVGRHLVAAYGLNKIMVHTKLPLIIVTSQRSIVLQTISDYSFSFATIGAIAGLTLGLQPVLSTPPLPEYYLFVALYLTLVPLGFFLPLWQTHKKLQASKQAALATLRERLQAEYETMISGKENATEAQMAHVQTLYGTVQLVEKSLEWPFQESALYRLVSTVIFPFLFVVLDWLLTLLDVGSGLFSF